MEMHQVRRLPVVDDEGICCGILAQADLAMNTEPTLTGEVVKRVSEPHRIPAV
jgi:CBS-domain-containing membrane protein